MFDSIWRYVSCCHTCHRSKASCEKYHGLLKLLLIPERRWQDTLVDFVVDLPGSEGFTNVMVVVDRLAEYWYLIPCKGMEASDVAWLFIRHVWVNYGLPMTIVSDWGRQFTSAFHDELCKQLNIELLFSRGHYPESDGHTENAREFIIVNFTNFWIFFFRNAKF